MIKITDQLLDEVVARAKASPRLRMNFNFHSDLADPVQRLLNAMEPGTYVRPHKHFFTEETFVIIKGKALAVSFADDGEKLDFCLLDSVHGPYGVEFAKNTYHTVTALETGTVLFEIKEGPYKPHNTESVAAWAPEEKSDSGNEFLKSIFRSIGIPSPF